MGIRFACHVCERRLNIKRELAGRRGVCPVCAAKIRIPLADTEKSTPVDQKPAAAGSTADPNSGGPRIAVSERSSPVATTTSSAPRTATGHPAQASVTNHTESVRNSPASQPLDVLDDGEEAQWYVRPPSGGQYGPANSELLRQWIGEGRVAAGALLWREGWPQWREAGDALPEYAAQLPASRSKVSFTDRPDDAPTLTRSAASPESATEDEASEKLAGHPAVGTTRKERASRRMLAIGVLSAVALSLILVLAFVATR